MFSLQAPDGDITVLHTIKELLDIHDKQEMENYVSKWSPHKSVATYLLWHYYLRKRNRTIEY